jgi:glycosyltransferase involved in cell wall biosynthesis
MDIFHAMDLLVLPSLTEGLPNVVLEAFTCAKPVIATGVGGVPEIVEDGINGLLLPKGKPNLLVESIKKLAASPDEARNG